MEIYLTLKLFAKHILTLRNLDNDGNEFSYHNYIEDDQWYDYSAGLIYGIKVNKHLGYFVEGKYNKYWNREWYDFKFGVNYIIF